ncbi:capsid [uncultured virus]|uniref:Capsid n=1 Tax=uncultured virus TaxID=340016 RepID=A0A2K9LSQ9_9VIRU|nr:capsid [uncultured virus]
MTARRSVQRPHSWSGLAGRIGAWAAGSQHARVALRHRFRGAGAKTVQGRRGRDTGFTSRYKDEALLYRRKAAPPRVRRRVRKFVARVQSVLDGEVGLQVAIVPYGAPAAGYVNPVVATPAQNSQIMPTIPGLYSMNGNHPSTTTNANWYDIYEIFQQYYTSGTLSNDVIIEFTNAVWDCKMYADSSNSAPAFVDMYECVARRDYGSASDPQTLLAASLPSTSSFTGASGPIGLATTSPGVTPFDAPAFCEQWKILKVRRYKLEPGTSASLQFRDPKHRKIEYQSKVASKSWNRGVTRCWIPIVYGVPTAAGTRQVAVSVVFDVVRNYHFRQISQSMPGGGLINL